MNGHTRNHAPHSSRPLACLHPTTRYHHVTLTRQQQQQQFQQPESISHARPLPTDSHLPEPPTPEEPTSPKEPRDTRRVYHVWRSRDNRKGRHRAVITGRRGPQSRRLGLVGEEVTQLKSTALGLARLVTRFPVWDISYLVAVSFVLGLLPLSTPFSPSLSLLFFHLSPLSNPLLLLYLLLLFSLFLLPFFFSYSFLSFYSLFFSLLFSSFFFLFLFFFSFFLFLLLSFLL